MVIDDKFYVGAAKDRQIIRMVRHIRRFHEIKKYVPGIYVVTLPLFHDGILEVYEISELKQKVYDDVRDAIHIVGAAPGKRQAIRLVRDIIDDIYKKTGTVDVEAFFSPQ